MKLFNTYLNIGRGHYGIKRLAVLSNGNLQIELNYGILIELNPQEVEKLTDNLCEFSRLWLS